MIGKKIGQFIADRFNRIRFNTSYVGPAIKEGELRWNPTDGTLDLGMIGGLVTQQVGQELPLPAYNLTGVEIGEGVPVYVTGRHGTMPTIAPAKSDSESTSTIFGVTTSTFGATGDTRRGLVTVFGYVRQIKTNYTGDGIWGTTWQANDKLYVSKTVAGQLTNIEPSIPHHSDVVATVAIVGAVGMGSISVINQKHHTLEELTDVNGTPLETTGQFPVWDNDRQVFDFDRNFLTSFEITKEPTGFVSPGDVVVSYDSTTRKVTLTGTVEAYWQGLKIDALTSGWVSEAHTATNGAWFLYYNGTAFVWSQTPWTFDMLQISFVNYGALDKWASHETHSFMQWESHKELHQTIGSYLQSGGDLSGYVLNSTTPAERRPIVSSTVIQDEDIPTTLPTLTSSLYTKLFLTGAGTSTFTVETADIVPLSGSQPYYNQFTGGAWQQTLLPVTNYMAVWLVAVPVSSDAGSQKYRYMWIQGQTADTSLSVLQARTPSSLNLGQLANFAPEFSFIGKVIIRYIGGDWQIIQVDKLTGTKIAQVATPAGNYLSIVASDDTISGAGTVSDPLISRANRQIILSKSTDFSPALSEIGSLYLVDCTAGNVTVSLPSVTGSDGLTYDIKKIDSSSNKIIIDPNSTETIEGETTGEILLQGESWTIVADSEWKIK